MIAKVEPLTSARALRGPFDYLLAGVHEGVGVGAMLVVPFGGRRMLGVVVEVAEESELPPERLAEPLLALEADVPAELVRLGLWVAREYVSTPARGLALVLPPGTGTGSGRRIAPRRSLAARLTDTGRAALTGGEQRLGERQRAALEVLAAGPQRVSALAREAGCDHAGVRRLEQRGLVALERSIEPPKRPSISRIGSTARVARLNGPQELALGEIVDRIDAPVDAERRLLLHGVTGSGKTEVYLRAVAAALQRGKTAIVLVPEIALTPQTAGRFVARFGDTVAILHSRLTARERFDEWSRLRSGEARVCVGPRSAVFAPLTGLGLIVVDEEHDGSYKQEGDPRYDARLVAEHRAAGCGAVLVVGSATPRPESVARHERLELPQRADGRALPPVELVDMGRSAARSSIGRAPHPGDPGRSAARSSVGRAPHPGNPAGTSGPLHPRTREALDEVRSREEKAIVLLNRRGWSNFLACAECGRSWGCPDCDVTLVLHRAAGTMSCHHCGHSERMPRRCPDCDSVSVSRHGIGTERLHAELEALMYPLPVFRLDADTALSEGIDATLQRFESAASGVLVGTQMVAKGHDFPDVTLGVVLDADSTLRFPDFRAEERTFALVAQLAGRSGRGPRGGRVVVQALDPGARALRHAAAHDSLGFVRGELERRAALGYPPYGNLIRVVCSAEEPGPEGSAAEAIRELIDPSVARVLGPAPLFRRAGRHRAQLVVKAPDRAAGIAAVRRAVETVAADRAHKGAAYAVDVDPQ